MFSVLLNLSVPYGVNAVEQKMTFEISVLVVNNAFIQWFDLDLRFYVHFFLGFLLLLLVLIFFFALDFAPCRTF